MCNCMVWKLLIAIIVYFVSKNRKLSCTCFAIANLLICFGAMVSDWLSVKFFYNFNLDNRHKLFGFQENNGIFQLINGLLLYARSLVYRCKYSKCKPNMAQYFNLVTSIRKSEYFIAKNKHDVETHDRK